MQATIGYLSGRFGISRRDITELLATLFQVEISLGSIAAQEQCVSQAVAQPVAAVEPYVQQQAAVNLDETSWPQEAQNFWLWVSTTPAVTVFRVLQTRGAQGKSQLLGADYAGIVGSDRYSAYHDLDPDQRQVCWSHLKRDFQALVERGGESQTIGRLLLVQEAQVFREWYQVRDGRRSREDFRTAMQPIRQEVSALLHIGTFVRHVMTRRTCQNILKVEPALWTFVDQAGVEPTKNAKEQSRYICQIWLRALINLRFGLG